MHGPPGMTNSTGGLTEVRENTAGPPGIILIMRDNRAFGEVGISHVRKMHGLETPEINRLAPEGA